MGLFSRRFGYESPAVGAWTFALSLQLALGILLLFVGYNNEETKELLAQLQADTNRYSITVFFGLAHILVAACTAVVVALGLFVSSCFLLPLCIISIVQSLLLVATSIFCGVLVRPLILSIRYSILDKDLEELGFSKGELLLATQFAGYLLTGACLSLAALVAYGRAGNMKNDTPIPEAQLYIPCGALLVASATLVAIGGGGENVSVWMAVFLFGSAVLLALLLNIAGCCCTPKVFNIVVGAGFAVIALVSLVVCCMAANTFKHNVETYSIFHFDVKNSKVPDPLPDSSDFRFFVSMFSGAWLIPLASMCLATSILAIFSALYGARSVLFCFGKGDTA